MNGLLYPMYEAGAATSVGIPENSWMLMRNPGLALRHALHQRELDSIEANPRLTRDERRALYSQYMNRRSREIDNAMMAPFVPAGRMVMRGLRSVAESFPEPEYLRYAREEALRRQQYGGMSDIDYNTLRYYQLLNERTNGR